MFMYSVSDVWVCTNAIWLLATPPELSSGSWTRLFVIFAFTTPNWMTSLLPVSSQNSTCNTSSLCFDHFSELDIPINPHKCLIVVADLDFPGNHINNMGVTPLQNKAQAVRSFPLPQTHMQLATIHHTSDLLSLFLLHGAEVIFPFPPFTPYSLLHALST